MNYSRFCKVDLICLFNIFIYHALLHEVYHFGGLNASKQASNISKRSAAGSGQ